MLILNVLNMMVVADDCQLELPYVGCQCDNKDVLSTFLIWGAGKDGSCWIL